MQISFFEEFPNYKNLSKLDLVKFPTKLYLAEYNIEGYKQYKKELQKKHKNLKEVIWWPILNVSEGYWLSPWSKRRALLRIFHYLINEKIPILWDAEFPKNRKLILTQFFKHFKNKELIRTFFCKYKGQIHTAEYFLVNGIIKKIFSYCYLAFNPNKYKEVIVIKMMYSSMSHLLTEDLIRKEIKKYKEIYKDKFAIGLGVLSVGINGNESLITPEKLERDLRICEEEGVKEVVIYQLNGLNEDYIEIIKKFT